MRIYEELDDFTLSKVLQRVSTNDVTILNKVDEILGRVQKQGDKAIFELTKELNHYDIDAATTKVSKEEFEEANNILSSDFKNAIDIAIDNISKFHKAQFRSEVKLFLDSGIELNQRRVAIQSVGIYVPSGPAPIFSTVIMCGVPAKIAGCKEIIITAPADKNGTVAPEILYAADRCGIDNIYKIGGAVAVAAMAYGTKSVKPVNKIFGPGDKYVICAKQKVATEYTAIDIPLGPSEVMIVADHTAKASYVAADLLSQLEHSVDSQAIVVTTNIAMAREIENEVNEQVKSLNKLDILKESLNNCQIIVEAKLERILDIVDDYAPQHLIVCMDTADDFAYRVNNAGTIFIGDYSPVSVGDYASGTNHLLPTNGWAKCYSGVNVDAFSKYITYQKLTSRGLKEIAPTVLTMAHHEGMIAHKKAIEIRLK